MEASENSLSHSATPASLLLRLQENPTDPIAWRHLVDRYAPRVYTWCRRWGLQEADARDATQDVLLKLASRMRKFRYDPARSFRAYLKTLTYYAWCDLVKLRSVPDAASQQFDWVEALDSAEARDDLAQRLDDAHRRQILDLAMERVSRRVEPRTWEAFRLLAIEGLPGAIAADRTGLKVASVFVARSRVQKMLQEEIGILDPP